MANWRLSWCPVQVGGHIILESVNVIMSFCMFLILFCIAIFLTDALTCTLSGTARCQPGGYDLMFKLRTEFKCSSVQTSTADGRLRKWQSRAF